jgi:cytochrome P450
VLLDNAANYRKSDLTRRLLEPGIGRGLLTSEGETWRRHRRIMAPAFDPRSVAGYAPIMADVVRELLERWRSLPAGGEIDISTEMMHTTLHIISRAMFSTDSDGIVDVVGHGVEEYQKRVRPTLLDLVGAPLWLRRILSPRRRIEAMVAFDHAVDDLIGARRHNPDLHPHDLLSRLIRARDLDGGEGMSAQEVRDQVVTIFMAGHETTAQALSWTFYLLARHPEVELKLHKELSEVLSGRPPSAEDLKNLPYTRMVIEESMRLYPPVHTMARQALGADQVLGHRIPAGATVLISPWLLHRKPSLWRGPDRYQPERFAADVASSRHRFAYIPFGAGPRICIGAAFAIQEAMLILALVSQHYILRLKSGHPVEPQGLITLRPRHGIRMLLERRAGVF